MTRLLKPFILNCTFRWCTKGFSLHGFEPSLQMFGLVGNNVLAVWLGKSDWWFIFIKNNATDILFTCRVLAFLVFPSEQRSKLLATSFDLVYYTPSLPQCVPCTPLRRPQRSLSSGPLSATSSVPRSSPHRQTFRPFPRFVLSTAPWLSASGSSALIWIRNEIHVVHVQYSCMYFGQRVLRTVSCHNNNWQRISKLEHL